MIKGKISHQTLTEKRGRLSGLALSHMTKRDIISFK